MEMAENGEESCWILQPILQPRVRGEGIHRSTVIWKWLIAVPVWATILHTVTLNLQRYNSRYNSQIQNTFIMNGLTDFQKKCIHWWLPKGLEEPGPYFKNNFDCIRLKEEYHTPRMA